MAEAKSSLLKDLYVMFRMNTAASSLLCLCSAGLPVFINRICLPGLAKDFPSEFFIPIEFSEVKSIEKIIEDIDWEKIYVQTMAHRQLFSIEKNIPRYLRFIEQFLGEHAVTK